jgi:hypothetical protein
MRTWVWLTLTASFLAMTAAAAPSESERENTSTDNATTRPASNAEQGEKAAPRRSGRSGRGEGRTYRSSPDSPDGGGARPPGRSEGRGVGPGSFGGEHGGPMFGASPEQTEKAMTFLKEQYPQRYEQLKALQEKDPRAFHRQMSHILPRMPELMHIIDRNPELGKLIVEEHRMEMDIRDALVQFRGAKGPDEIEQTKDRIRTLIGNQFDIRQKKLQLMIGELERELQRKKQLLADQAGKKNEIIDQEVERRLRPDQ